MTVPLPGGWADELLWHLRNCPACISARVTNSPTRCHRGRTLIQLTLKERHGDK